MEQGTWHANVASSDGRLLRQLAATMQAKKVVELGTSSGYSAIWLALALRKTGGRLYTHEIDPKMARLARANFRRAGVDKQITVILGDAHKTVAQHKASKAPIDLVFLDADKSGYLDYLHKLLPLVRPGGMIVAHNMRVPRPDPRYIKAVTTDPKLDTMFVLMDGAGMALTLKKR